MQSKQEDLKQVFTMAKYCRKLQLIRDEIQTYERFTAKENFLRIELTSFYVGQLVKLSRELSEEMQTRLAGVPWQELTALHEKLIRQQGKRDTKLLWQVVSKDAPSLARKCLEILKVDNPNVEARINSELAAETGRNWEAT